jgi:uncharacterized protein (DUF2235 family)
MPALRRWSRADGILIDRLLGGAFGTGLFKKVKEGYTKIAHDYLDGDEILPLGFSRVLIPLKV